VQDKITLASLKTAIINRLKISWKFEEGLREIKDLSFGASLSE